MKLYQCILFMCVFPVVLHADLNVMDSRQFQQDGSSLIILSGSVELPPRGIWVVDTKKAPVGFELLSVVEPEEALQQLTGRRMGAVELEKQIKQSRYTLRLLASTCFSYAKNHTNSGPTTVEDLKATKEHLVKWFNESPWKLDEAKRADGPFYYLIPDVEFKVVDNETWVRAGNRKPLAFELRPYVGDGKHWVCYTDRTCIRVEIDEKMVAEHGQSINPVFAEPPNFDELPPAFTYEVVAALSGSLPNAPVSIPLENLYTKDALEISWDMSAAQAGDASLKELLREYHKGDWWSYLQVSKSPVLQAWLAMAGEHPEGGGRRRRGENTSAFGVMGGYAAVRETLQMQLLNVGTSAQERVVPIEEIEGVKVTSHPYEEMLGEQTSDRVTLAERIPHDRFFVYMAKPEAMLPLLDEGAGFLSELGGAVTGNSIQYNLKERYLKRLGADEQWLRAFLLSGGVNECALMAPDMFFIDGTEITVVSRMANPMVVMPLLKMLGVAGLDGKDIVKKINREGEAVYWAVRQDLLIVGTSKAEVQLVLDLDANNGTGSLGKSAEFRYMLTQLPLNDQTRCYAYCSDPFIRNLVGPATKIGQLRRVEAMNHLKQITAAALLAQLDGFGRIQSLEALKAKGYLPEAFASAGYSLDAELVARSDVYGTLANLRSISSVPVVKATEGEAKQYGNYVQNYSRFWRQFFDPIALRLDDAPDASLEATVFILPLIDSSIYNGIKQFVMAQEDGTPLKTPRFSPDPVLQFSVNLKEAAWQSVSETLSDILSGHAQLDPAIVDDFGPSVHLFVNDSDPVISLGSGDILGGFGGNAAGLGRNNQMMLIPFVASMLTRSCTIAVETSHPEKTIMYLRNAADSFSDGSLFGGDELRSEIYQIEDRDSWVCLFDIMGAVKLRYGLEVQDGFLMIRNIPWSSKDQLERIENSNLNGMGLKVYPEACKLQLPGLHSTAAEKSRASALQGIGHLFPLLSSGYATMDHAAEIHMKLFGFTPRQANADNWAWQDDVLESSLYGSVYRKKQPAYTEGDDGFGLMGAIQELGLEMQFEHTGLRTKIKWKTRKD